MSENQHINRVVQARMKAYTLLLIARNRTEIDAGVVADEAQAIIDLLGDELFDLAIPPLEAA